MAGVLASHPRGRTTQDHAQSKASQPLDSSHPLGIPGPSRQPSMQSFHVGSGSTAKKPVASYHPELVSPSAVSYEIPSNAPKIVKLDPIEKTPWFSEYDIPDELELLAAGVPEQIRNVVRESIDQYRALKASALESIAQEQPDAGKVMERTAIHQNGIDSTAGLAISMSADSKGSNGLDNETAASSDRSSSSYHSTNTSLSIADSALTVNFSDLTINELRVGMTSQESLGSEMSNGTNSLGERDGMHRKLLRLPAFLQSRKGKANILTKSVVTHPLDEQVECTGCMDDIPKSSAVGMSCRCQYCTTCFNRLIQTATQNEATFPPRCCLQEVPKDKIRLFLSSKDYAHFELKTKEYAVPAERRWYCTSPTCGKWILVPIYRLVLGSVKCNYCQYEMCAHCRGPAHGNDQECPQDRSLEATLEQAEQEGWRRCYKCRAIVELATGCRHVTCRCKAEFCYICGAKWRTCACTETDHAQRRTEVRERRQRLDAAAQAEEAEIRAAIEAVAAAERDEAKKRAAEEAALAQQAQEIERREQQRLEDISGFYMILARILEQTHSRQREAIVNRHRSFAQAQERASLHQVEEECLSNKIKTIAKSQSDLIDLNRLHAMAIAEVHIRHREQLDDLNLELGEFAGDGERNALARLQLLIQSQEQEISILTSMHIRKIQMHRDRSKRAWENVELSSNEQKARHHEERERSKQAIARQVFADWKWFDRITTERRTMLEEDQGRYIQSGADAPTVPGPSSQPIAQPAAPGLLPPIYVADPVPRRSPFRDMVLLLPDNPRHAACGCKNVIGARAISSNTEHISAIPQL